MVPRASRGSFSEMRKDAPSAWPAHYKTSPTANEPRPACFSAKNGYAWRSPPRISAFGIGMSPSNRLYWSDGVEALFDCPRFVCRHLPCVYRPDLHFIGSRFHSDPHRTQPATTTSITIRHRVVWPDGTIHWLAWTGRIYRNADGAATRVLGIIRHEGAHQRLDGRHSGTPRGGRLIR